MGVKPYSKSVEKWRPEAEAAAAESGVDVNLIMSMINTESEGDETAANGVAYGLMAISPTTWDSTNQASFNGQYPFSDNWSNGAINIRFGACILACNIRTSGIEGALKQYGGYQNGDPNFDDYYTEVTENAKTAANGGGVDYTVSGSSGGYSGGGKANDPRGILKFAQFAQSMAFTQQLREGFERSVEDTLHTYLMKFMRKFYHNLYYVPTLPNNKAIVVKPETMFVDPPSCNVIYPSFRFSLGTSRTAKSEPTRIIMISDPVTNIFGTSGGNLSQLVTMSFIEKDTTNGGQKVVGLGAMQDKRYPMHNLTSYEKENGVRILRVNQGEDLYLFLVSNTSGGKAKTGGGATTVLSSSTDSAGIGKTLGELATYELLRNRYSTRTGSANMYFNPYIVPGFPFVSLESGVASSMNIYGYVTDVTHQLTERSWTTTISFTAGHISNEPRPPAFPIVESEYTEKLSETYASMLGATVSRVEGMAGADACRAAYNASDISVSSGLKRVWRPLTTLEQHLDTVLDGATLIQDDNYKWIQNGNSTFFDTSVQDKLKTYTKNIIEGFAMNEDDVR